MKIFNFNCRVEYRTITDTVQVFYLQFDYVIRSPELETCNALH